MDYSPPGSSAHGIFQARILEWVAISFSNICMYMCVTVYIYLLALSAEKLRIKNI